jgi:protein Tex
MKEFSSYIARTWKIREPIAHEICEAFEKDATPNYLADYRPDIMVETDAVQLWSIYTFLKDTNELAPQKKRLIHALEKSGKLADDLKRRITMCVNPFELDDLLLPERPNPRSKAQLAIKKGLGTLADRILLQEDEGVPLSDLMAPYIGTDASLKDENAVFSGVQDILAEHFAYDINARTMSREFAFDDGFFEVHPKNKKDPAFARFVNKFVQVQDLSDEDMLMLLSAEEKKTIRLKLNVQLFRISEMLRHHFITNPDAAGFDIICMAIDDCWVRLLQPVIDRDVKIRLGKEAQDKAMAGIADALRAKMLDSEHEGAYITCGVFDAAHLALVAFNSSGRLLGAAFDKKPVADKPVGHSDRLKQFIVRYKPSAFIIPDDELVPQIETIIKRSVDSREVAPEIIHLPISPDCEELAASEWMKQNFADLDGAMSKAFALGLLYKQPFVLMPQIGIRFFPIHPLQAYMPVEKMTEAVNRILAEKQLVAGINIAEADCAAVQLLPGITEDVAKEVHLAGHKKSCASKSDLLKLPGMTETIFRNIAGYILIPYAEEALDRTRVHPEHYAWVIEMSKACETSVEGVIAAPEVLSSYPEEDVARKFFIQNRLMEQLAAGQKFAAATFTKHRRKLKLDELQEGTIVSGRVTNITPFGVFVNINAVSEGLIHISQLADSYIESPDQVVALGDMVNVRIIKVDTKKRRISLAMRGVTAQPVKVAPSQRQLSSLADHFQNR